MVMNNQNNINNMNYNNGQNIMNNMAMNNNMGMINMGLNNNMGMNSIGMNNMGMNNMGMNNNIRMNNMGMYNNIGMNNMGTYNNIGMNNNMGMYNNIGMNNNMGMNNNIGMNNIGMINNIGMNNNMGMNNFGMNNMSLIKYNQYNFPINWYNYNYFLNNMNYQYYLYIIKILQNAMLQRQYFLMIYQQKLMKKMLMQKRMNEILENSEKNSNQNNNVQIENNEEDDFVPNQALLDVIQEPNPPHQQPPQNNQNMNNPILSSNLVSEVIADVINLNPDLLSGLGNNLLGEWAQGENRGGRPYKPPNGWIGYGLNVLNKYDNGNNDWLACNGRKGEWCIAYHGACNGQSSDNVKKGIKSILETNLKPGGGQAYANHNDANHPGKKVGKGVYCSPEPSVIDGYSGIMNINGHNYKAAFMLRVRPDKLRYSNSRPDYWVVNGSFDELRPYRLLIKPI